MSNTLLHFIHPHPVHCQILLPFYLTIHCQIPCSILFNHIQYTVNYLVPFHSTTYVKYLVPFNHIQYTVKYLVPFSSTIHCQLPCSCPFNHILSNTLFHSTTSNTLSNTLFNYIHLFGNSPLLGYTIQTCHFL